MTMPHLMNCEHSEDGWCLGCVKALHAEREEAIIDAGTYEYTLQAIQQRIEDWLSSTEDGVKIKIRLRDVPHFVQELIEEVSKQSGVF